MGNNVMMDMADTIADRGKVRVSFRERAPVM